MKQATCGKCGSTGVRIYREYGSFRRPETDRCNDCVDSDSYGYMVPCVLDKDGNAWGYLSVPEDDAEKNFYSLPEKSDTKPHWVDDNSSWSNRELI